ncbi:MAG: type 1 glutamine amidotransferase [Gallionellaceae bacterium]|nr:type 1 glutamine amidotransferase [Gallionellaceae bacterium]
MKPIAIFRHFHTEGPGYFADFLDERAIPWQLIRIDVGDAVPQQVTDFAGLVFMGGPMSVNDPLPWIEPVLALIRSAVAHDIPVLGHCLGGQLMAKALGGKVGPNPVKEIGWGRATVSNNPEAHTWFGEMTAFEAFHWHGETFSVPPQAVHLLTSAYCANQAFALGKHLGLQCHVEMTEEMIQKWCRTGANEITASASSPAVQSVATIQAQSAANLPRLHAVAHQLYQHWLAGLIMS